METHCPLFDPTCGSRSIHFERNNPLCIFMDQREYEGQLCDGRDFKVKPDLIADFRNIPFPDETFHGGVFDPPHLIRGGNGWQTIKYGLLRKEWKDDLKKGFDECMRVLKPFGFLIVKWNSEQIKVSEFLAVVKQKPFVGDHRLRGRGNTYWMIFIKTETQKGN